MTWIVKTDMSDMVQLNDNFDSILVVEGRSLLPVRKHRTSARVVLATLLLASALVVAGCNGKDTTGNANANAHAPVISAPPKTALPMPPLNGKSLEQMGWSLTDGSRNAFSTFKGKVLILDFYATWCEPCRVSIPHLIDLQHRYEKEVRVVGLNVGGPGDDQRVPDFAKEFKITYSLGIPDEDLVALLLSDSDAIPQTFVFDTKGQLVERFIGFGDATGARIDKAVEAAVRSATD